MATDTEGRAFGCGVVLATVIVSGAMSACVAMKYVSKKQVIKHGAAYYHPQTGKFTWREKPEESE